MDEKVGSLRRNGESREWSVWDELDNEEMVGIENVRLIRFHATVNVKVEQASGFPTASELYAVVLDAKEKADEAV